MKSRYAIYIVPEPKTTFAKLGSSWLGRDSESGKECEQPLLAAFSPERLYSLTAEARRYGLHATLKAPFYLKTGQTEQDLLAAMSNFISGREDIQVPRLVLSQIGNFFALVPASQSMAEKKAIESINRLAADAVSFFDPFRAEPSEAELERRNPHKLSERQQELLFTWGYPYVFDEYRCHFTLTDSIKMHNIAALDAVYSSVAALGDNAVIPASVQEDLLELSELKSELQGYFSPLFDLPLHIASLCICKQYTDMPKLGTANNSFILLQRFKLHVQVTAD